MQAARRRQWDLAYWLAKQATEAHGQTALLHAVQSALGEQAVRAHLLRAQREQEAGDALEAGLDYRAALAIQPKNSVARRALMRLFALAPAATAGAMLVRRAAPPVQLALPRRPRSFNLHGGLRRIIGDVAGAYGLRAYIQNTVPDAPVRLHVGEATFGQAAQLLRHLGHVTWTAVGPHTVYFGLASQARSFQPLELRTFYLPWVTKPTDLVELEQMLRVILDPYEVQGNTAAQSITVRAQPTVVDAAERLLLNLSAAPGGVMFEVQVAEVNRSLARELGVTAPYQLQALALGPILSQLSSANLSESQLLQALFQSGGLNGLLSAGQLTAQLAGLESQIAPLLSTPLATFGGGLTAMALTLPPATLHLSLNTSRSETLQQAWLRADAGQPATLQIGERYPVVNATFSPILNSAAISKVLGSGTFQPPFPSFTFINLGLSLKLTPHLDARGRVLVRVQAREEALSGASNNGIPVLEDHRLSTLVDLRDGEPALVAGLASRQNEVVHTALPGLGQIPGLEDAFGTSQTNRQQDELVVVITPHILHARRPRTQAIWLPADDFRTGGYAPAPYSPPVAQPPESPRPPAPHSPFFQPRQAPAPASRPAQPTGAAAF